MLNKRAQIFLEFLMTYGWALAIVVIVLLVLFALGLFSPPSSTASAPIISGFSQLVVTNAAANNSVFEFSVDNEANINLNITSIEATTSAATYTNLACNSKTLSPGSTVYCGLQQASLLTKQTTFSITLDYAAVSNNLITGNSTGVITISPTTSAIKILFK
jgi:P pilus assembly chaperone PapD